MPNDKFSEDFIATNPGLKYIKSVGLYDTDPNAPDQARTLSDSTLTVFHNPDGKFSAFLFVINGQVFRSVAIIRQVTEQRVLVDYTKSSTEPDNCGNGILESGEKCDGNAFGQYSGDCTAYKSFYAGGKLSCTNDCQIDTSSCTES